MMHLVQTRSPAKPERQVTATPVFSGDAFDVAEAWEHTHQGTVRAAALAMFAAPSFSRLHTSNSGRDFMTERAAQLGQPLPHGFLKALARIEGIKPRVADGLEYPEWVLRLHIAKSQEVKEVTRTISMLMERLDAAGHEVVSRDLDMVNVAKAHPYHLLAALRTLFQQRYLIEGWRGLEQRTRKEFEKKGLNAARVMKGLNVDDKVRAAE